MEVCEPVDAAVGDFGRVRVRDLPAAAVASLIHEGSYDTFNASYGAMMDWIGRNGYRIVGPNREVYIRGPEHGDDPSGFITEIEFPVVKV